ncbi:MAG: acyltransferase [Pseudomonadota bacterium]
MGIFRFLLASSVVFSHVPPWIGLTLFPGNLAVEMFFVVSGFYMSLILSGRYDPTSWAGRSRFYASRFARLWPTFLLTAVCVQVWWIIVSIYLGRAPTGVADYYALIDNSLVYFLLHASNWLMIGQDVAAIFHVSADSGVRLSFGPPETLPDGSVWLGFILYIGQAWSIGTEIWFYLIAPFLITLSTRTLLAVALASLVLRATMSAAGLEVYFFFPTQLVFFVTGMLAHRHAKSLPLRSGQSVFLFISIVGASAVIFSSVIGLDERFKWLLYPFVIILLPAVFDSTKRNTIDRNIGDLSYPIYITHMFILGVYTPVSKQLGLALSGEIILAITVLASVLILIFVEKPVNTWRERFANL